MPQFILDTGNPETHKAFDAMPEIARGYLEAAFFTGLQYYDGDGEPVEIDGLGLENLDPGSLAAMVADACRFWLENAETLERATESGAYDLEQAGRDFWLSRGGFGVGFLDREELDPETRDALDNAASAAGEVYWSAEPSPDAMREAFAIGENENPTALAEIAAEREAEESGTGWRVTLDFPGEPLTDAERAALEALEGGPAPALPDVGGRYGAPLGRRSGALDPDSGEITARRVTLDPGGYDSGGAYWGTGAPLWRVIDGDGESAFVRAGSRADAIREACA